MNFNHNISGAATPQFQKATPVTNASKEASYNEAQWGAQQDILSHTRPSGLENLATFGAKFTEAYFSGAKERKATKSGETSGALAEELAKASEIGATDPSYNVEKKQREIRAKYVAANPGDAGAINKTYKTVTGRNVAEITREQAQFRELKSDASKAGFVFSWMDDKDAQKGVELYQVSLNQQAQLKSLQTNKKLTRERFMSTELPDMVSTSTQSINLTGNAILRKVSTGDMSVSDAKIAFAKMELDIDDTVASLGELGNDEDIVAVIAPLKKRIKLMTDLATGKIDQETRVERQKQIESEETLLFLSDPKRKRLMMSTKLVGPEVTALLVQDPLTVQEFGNYIAGKTDPENPNESPEQATNRDYSARFEDPMGGTTQPNGGEVRRNRPSRATSFDSRGMNPSTRRGFQTSATNNVHESQETTSYKEASLFIDDTLNHALRNGEDYSASDWNNMFNTIPNSGDLVKVLPVSTQMKYEDAYQRFSTDQMPKVINEVLNNNMVHETNYLSADVWGGGYETDDNLVDAPLTDLVDVSISDTGMMLRAKDEYKSNPTVRRVVREANARLAAEIVPAYKSMAAYHNESLSTVLNTIVGPLIKGYEAPEGSVKQPEEAPQSETDPLGSRYEEDNYQFRDEPQATQKLDEYGEPITEDSQESPQNTVDELRELAERSLKEKGIDPSQLASYLGDSDALSILSDYSDEINPASREEVNVKVALINDLEAWDPDEVSAEERKAMQAELGIPESEQDGVWGNDSKAAMARRISELKDSTSNTIDEVVSKGKEELASLRSVDMLGYKGSNSDRTLAQRSYLRDKDLEGVRKNRYKSPEGGSDTVGIGHKLSDQEDEGDYVLLNDKKRPLDVPLTDSEINQLYWQDYNTAYDSAKDYVNGLDSVSWDSLSEDTKRLILRLEFNSGDNLRPVQKALAKGDDETAKKGLLKSIGMNNNSVVSAGLARARASDVNDFLGGDIVSVKFTKNPDGGTTYTYLDSNGEVVVTYTTDKPLDGKNKYNKVYNI